VFEHQWNHKGPQGEVVATLNIGGVTINSGNIIVADADAVLVLPTASICEAVSAGEFRVAKERQMMERLRAVETTLEILGLKGRKNMTTVAILGTGRMGTAFVKRLIEVGQPVTVWNRTAAHTDAAAKAGATVVTDIAAAAASNVILISLTNATAVNAVIVELIKAGISGKLVIDLSTLLPDETKAIGSEITTAGADFVDCPVGGTVGPALKGLLLGMAGGTEAAFARAKRILDCLCKRVELLGPIGAGAHMKLAVNLPLAIYWKALAEALVLLDGSDISTDMAISMIADSSAGPAVLKNRAQIVVDTMNGTDQPGTFDIAGLLKDLDLALVQSAKSGRSMPLSEETRKSYIDAISAGLGHFDGASLTRHLSRT
jgi:3-hydroxyisobutyrate dehydrogenase